MKSLLTCLLVFAPLPALANPAAPAASSVETAQIPAPDGDPSSSTSALSGFDAGARVDNDGLHAMTGREDLNLVVNARNTAEVTGNTVTGTSVTGAVDFSSGAFQNLNGLAVISANTGNNVAINSSLNINVAVRP